MNNTLLIARRELGAYFKSMSGYVIAALVLLIDGLLFNALVLDEPNKRSAQVLSDFFYIAAGTTMISSVLLSMRLLAEEKQTGTIVLLTSSPVRDREIVLGKYLAGIGFLALMILGTLYMPLMVMINGKVSLGHLAAGYLGLLLLGSATMAVGTFGSAIARSQVLAVVISGVLVTGLVVSWMLAAVTERPFNEVFLQLALFHRHFTPFMDGVIHTRDVAYYLLLTYFALFSATRVLEARRWR